MSNQSILLRILHEIQTRNNTTRVVYLQNHERKGSARTGTSSVPELRIFSNLADQEAKLTLSLPRPSVPDEMMFHSNTILNKHNISSAETTSVSEENSLWKMYNKHFQMSCKHYNLKGKWHLYRTNTPVGQIFAQ